MYIDDFFWLPDIEDKLVSKHQVTREEVEEVFFNRPHFALWKPATALVKMSTPQGARQMLVVT